MYRSGRVRHGDFLQRSTAFPPLLSNLSTGLCTGGSPLFPQHFGDFFATFAHHFHHIFDGPVHHYFHQVFASVFLWSRQTGQRKNGRKGGGTPALWKTGLGACGTTTDCGPGRRAHTLWHVEHSAPADVTGERRPGSARRAGITPQTIPRERISDTASAPYPSPPRISSVCWDNRGGAVSSAPGVFSYFAVSVKSFNPSSS